MKFVLDAFLPFVEFGVLQLVSGNRPEDEDKHQQAKQLQKFDDHADLADISVDLGIRNHYGHGPARLFDRSVEDMGGVFIVTHHGVAALSRQH